MRIVENESLTGITGGHVLDPAGDRFAEADVALAGDLIADVLAPGSLAGTASSFDASGLFVLPGLIDCHVHLAMRGEDADPSAGASRTDEDIAGYAAEAAERTLLAGVTSVRDVGGWNYVEMALRDDIESGRRMGPRLFLAGRLLSRPTPAVAFYPGMYEVVEGPNEIRAAVRRQLSRGADVIKVMATGAMLSPQGEDAREVQLGPDELTAAVEEAAASGKPVAAHAHAAQGIRNAVEAGVASIEHGTHADDEILGRMAERGTFLVPTCSAARSMLGNGGTVGNIPKYLRDRLIQNRERHLAVLRTAHRLGVPIAMGTDAGTPNNHHGANAEECLAMVDDGGFTTAESIRAATLDAARLLRCEEQLGSVERGKFADLIGLAEDPLRDIRALTRVVFVVKGGRLFRHERSNDKRSNGDPSP